MKFETINKKRILLISVIVFVVVLSLVMNTSLAKYKITKSIKLASGTINYSPADFNLMGIYIESDEGYINVDEVPSEGYEFNNESSYCEKSGVKQDVTINYDIESNALSITPMKIKA